MFSYLSEMRTRTNLQGGNHLAHWRLHYLFSLNAMTQRRINAKKCKCVLISYHFCAILFYQSLYRLIILMFDHSLMKTGIGNRKKNTTISPSIIKKSYSNV